MIWIFYTAAVFSSHHLYGLTWKINKIFRKKKKKISKPQPHLPWIKVYLSMWSLTADTDLKGEGTKTCDESDMFLIPH